MLLFLGVDQAKASISLVQHNSTNAGTTTTATLAFTSNNTSGNWIAVCIRAENPGETFTVSDSKGNVYRSAVQYSEIENGNILAIFYAENIASGANSVTVSDSVSANLSFAIFEYSGLATSGSLDAIVGTQGSSTSPNSASVTTRANGDLLLGAILTANTATFTVGSGYALEESVPAEPNTQLIVEDQIQANAGAASATASITSSDYGDWAAVLVAFSPVPEPPPIAFVQVNGTAPQTPQTTVSLPYTLAQTAGDLNVVVVGWNDSTTTVSSVADSKGNAYSLAVGPTVQTNSGTQAIYYAKNIASAAANSNNVTVTFSTAANYPDIRIVEYSGVDTVNPLDVTAAAQGMSATSDSGTVTTTNANDLLVGANLVQGYTTSPGVGYTSRLKTDPDGDILEDRVVTTAGTYSATAPVAGSNAWIMQMVAFKPASSGGGTPTITSVNPTAGPVGTSVTVTGTNFGSTQGTSTIKFNGTAATPASWSATTIIVPVPSGATTGNVVVTVAGVASNGVAFTVALAPTITSFTPTSASIGSLISVTGTNFTVNNSTPVVTLNQQGGGTIPASVSSFSGTNVSFVIPTGAATGPITVTANGLNAVSSTSLMVIAASSFTLNATPGTATLLPGQTTTLEVTLTSTNGFTQLADLRVSGVPSGVTAAFQPPQITGGQFSILTLTAPSGQAPGASGLAITASATVQGISESSSANVTLQVQGTSGVAFAGRVAVTDAYDTPLVGVTIRMMGVNQTGVSTGCTGSTTTDGSGNFVLNGLSASCAGGQLIQYDPSTVTSPSPGAFSGVTLSYQLTSGQVTTPGPPGFIVHLPRVDNAETFSVQQNASVDQTFISRSIPGLTITVYANTTLTLANGTSPSPFPLSVVEIPYDRLPELMPPNPTQDPVFAMSIEPFNSSSNQPVAVSFPNRHNLLPGTGMPLTSLNPTMGIMVNYGTGTVSADGAQVVPDLDSAHPGHRYGISHFDWHFPVGGANANNPSPSGPTGGDPIDLASGLQVVTKTDILFGGARGQVAITRTFRGATTNPGPFGIGTNHNYGYLLDTSNLAGGLIYLLMPDGNRFPFVQSGAIFVNTTIPSDQGAVISNLSCAFGNGCGAALRWKNGTIYTFQALTGQGSNTSFLASITDSNGNKTTLARNALALITQIIDAVGRSLNLTYDGSRRITSISDPIGRTVQYTYNPQGYLATVTDANSPAGVTTYGYDANNNLKTITNARNIVYLTNTYDSNGRVTQQQTVDGAVTKFAYTLANPTIPTSPVLMTTVTDPLNNQTTYHFNPAGFVLDIMDALGRKTVFARDSGTNLLLSVTDPLGRTTTFTYDSAGNTTNVTIVGTAQNATTASFTYEPVFNKLASITDPLRHITSFAYDKAGNLTQITDPVDPPAALAYDGVGELLSATDPLGNVTTLAYDGFGNLVQSKDPLGRTAIGFADAVGRIQSITNPLGQKAQFQYNPRSQVTQITDSLNGQTSLTYDPNGNLLSFTDASGPSHTTNYTYDNMDRLATRKDPLGNTESYQYDPNGNLTQFTDRRGKVITYNYDAVNRRIFAGFGATPGPPYESTINYSYDAGDRLVQAVDSITGTITRTYDGLDRLTSEVSSRGSVSYSYDAAGRRTSMSVGGQSSITYSFDNANHLTQISQGSANVVIVPDSDGRRQSLTLPNGVKMAYSYDVASQLTGITYTLGSNTLGNLSYAYDLTGQRTTVGGSYARTGTPQAVSPATYNVNNQLTQWKGANLTYDANGNLTSDGTNTYTWNARNQLVAISGGASASFQYDPFGRRVSKTIGGMTQYLYDGANPVQEISGTSASANLLTGGADEYFQRTDSAGARNFLTDALGSTLALADSSGALQTQYTFEPFGNTSVTGTATANSFVYTGREFDSTGLYFYRARYYNARLQRFISEDPIGFAGGNNLYAYVGNNPASWTDPLGLFPNPFGGIRGTNQSFGDCMKQHAQDYSLAGATDLLINFATGEDLGIRNTFVGNLLGGNHVMGLYGLVAEGDSQEGPTLMAHGGPETIAWSMGSALSYGRRTSDIISLNLAGKGGVPKLLTAAPEATEMVKAGLEGLGKVLNLGMSITMRLAVDVAFTGAEAIGCSMQQ
jgi:RHS repeat-associated protein